MFRLSRRRHEDSPDRRGRIVPTAPPIALSFRASNTGSEMFDRALTALDRFTITENALQLDVHSARIGVLRNYDQLVRGCNDLDASLLRLRQTAAVDAATAATLHRLAAAVAKQEALVEQFKSNNALLQRFSGVFRVVQHPFGNIEPDRIYHTGRQSAGHRDAASYSGYIADDRK
ncbi:DAHL domain-containing protein [Rhodopila sp.]|uniref:DAHL domain-containing protein n=1 Tax=Rhodopila sp. TaxID=2480087 RepID=UPI003D0EFB2D